jgi:hypothetical protein
MPKPKLLKTLKGHTGQWLKASVVLPPERAGVLVMLRGDNCPAYAWLKFSAGMRSCPFFVVPQRAAMEPRGCHISALKGTEHRQDVTVWYAPEEAGLPINPRGYQTHRYGLGGSGWEEWTAPATHTGEAS